MVLNMRMPAGPLSRCSSNSSQNRRNGSYQSYDIAGDRRLELLYILENYAPIAGFQCY